MFVALFHDVSSYFAHHLHIHLGLSENSVPLHPMVNDHYPLLNGYNWGYTPFSDIPICTSFTMYHVWSPDMFSNGDRSLYCMASSCPTSDRKPGSWVQVFAANHGGFHHKKHGDLKQKNSGFLKWRFQKLQWGANNFG